MPQVRLEVAGIGVSVVGPTQELLYAAVTGVRARGTASSGRLTLELAVQVSFDTFGLFGGLILPTLLGGHRRSRPRQRQQRPPHPGAGRPAEFQVGVGKTCWLLRLRSQIGFLPQSHASCQARFSLMVPMLVTADVFLPQGAQADNAVPDGMHLLALVHRNVLTIRSCFRPGAVRHFRACKRTTRCRRRCTRWRWRCRGRLRLGPPSTVRCSPWRSPSAAPASAQLSPPASPSGAAGPAVSGI